MTNDNRESNPNKPLFLYIPPARLILLSLVSLGLYEAYWIYKNWQYIKQRDDLKIRPFWRGVFGVLFCHSLLRRIHQDKEARSIQAPTFSPNQLATWWVILTVFSNVSLRISARIATPETAILELIAYLVPSFLFFVPVQNYINAVTEKSNPSQKFYGWSSGHVICLIFGIIVWLLIIVGLIEIMQNPTY